jgi:regulator of replication initiation timing
VESATLLKQLVETERVLRTQNSQQHGQIRRTEAENKSLQNENQELREKLELLEYLVSSSENPEPPGDPTSYVAGEWDETARLGWGRLAMTSRAEEADCVSWWASGGASTQHIPEYGETINTVDNKGDQDLSQERHDMMKRQLAALQYQNCLLKQEMEQLKQAHAEVHAPNIPVTETALARGAGRLLDSSLRPADLTPLPPAKRAVPPEKEKR